jgi:hypothetical protein
MIGVMGIIGFVYAEAASDITAAILAELGRGCDAEFGKAGEEERRSDEASCNADTVLLWASIG